MIAPRPHLLALERDHEIMPDRAGFVRLDRNERVAPFNDSEFRDLILTLTSETFCSYPDPGPLYRRLSMELGVPQSWIHVTNGSDAAIRKVFQTYVRAGDLVVYPDPTYAMYPVYSRMFEAEPAAVPYSADRRLDLSVVKSLLARRPRLLAIANPDQPTGSVLPESDIRDLAELARRGDTVLLIDEAYYPCYPHTAVSLTRDFDNVIVSRTFSKVGGLAGLRLGFLVANPNVIASVNRVRGAFEVNAAAIAMGCLVLDRPDIGDRYLRDIEEGRAVLAATAADLGLGLPPCPTNFQLVELPEGLDTRRVVDELFKRKYLVKGAFTAPSVRRCIRVTLGDAEVMRGFAGVLRDVLVVKGEQCGH